MGYIKRSNIDPIGGPKGGEGEKTENQYLMG